VSTFSDRLLENLLEYGKQLALGHVKYNGDFENSLYRAVDRAEQNALPKVTIRPEDITLDRFETLCEMETAESRGSQKAEVCHRRVVMVCRHCEQPLCGECQYSYCMFAKDGKHERGL
jgi:hypothetical protein